MAKPQTCLSCVAILAGRCCGGSVGNLWCDRSPPCRFRSWMGLSVPVSPADWAAAGVEHLQLPVPNFHQPSVVRPCLALPCLALPCLALPLTNTLPWHVQSQVETCCQFIDQHLAHGEINNSPPHRLHRATTANGTVLKRFCRTPISPDRHSVCPLQSGTWSQRVCGQLLSRAQTAEIR